MSLLDNAYNYYERLVLEELAEQTAGMEHDEDFLIDACCVALNQLPCRYFRHGVDMAFYLSADEFLMMKAKVKDAVGSAISRVAKSGRL
jgi:hypothetical protein